MAQHGQGHIAGRPAARGDFIAQPARRKAGQTGVHPEGR